MTNKRLWFPVIALIVAMAFIGCDLDNDGNSNNGTGNGDTGNNGGGTVGPNFNVSNLQEWNEVVTAINAGGDGRAYTINITGDFSRPGNDFFAGHGTPTFTPTNITVTIQGNRTISISSGGSLLAINAGQTFILRDVNLRGATGGGSLVYIFGGTLTMQGGAAIYDNTNSGVDVVRGGTFIMQGNSSVRDNRNGGVLISGADSTFTMQYDSSVHSNRSLGMMDMHIGGVSVTQGATFIMRGNSSVRDNTGRDAGGGVRVLTGSTFTMEDNSSVSDNVLVSGTQNQFGGRGGGVFVDGGSVFTMRDNSSVSGNAAGSSLDGGGGVFVLRGFSGGIGGTFIMLGGTISGNSTSFDGGGIAVSGIFQIYNGTIYGSNAGDNSNTSSRGAALFLGTNGTTQHGTFSDAGVFTSLGNLVTTNNTIRVVNGALQ